MQGLLEQIRKDRRIPFVRRGMAIEVNGKRGRITGGNTQGNLNVRLDGQSFTRSAHPWWRTKYYAEDSTLVAEYGD